MKKIRVIQLVVIGIIILGVILILMRSNSSLKTLFQQKDNTKVISNETQNNQSIEPSFQYKLKALAEDLRVVPVQSLDVMAAQEQGLIYPEINDYILEVMFSKDISQGKSGLIYTFYQPNDTKVLKDTDVFFPLGLQIINSNSLDDDEFIGDGIYNFVLDGINSVSQVTILNSRDTQGHFAHWKFYFGPRDNLSSYYLSGFIDKNAKGIFKMAFARKFLYDIRPPIKFQVNLYTNSEKSHPVFVVPQGGNHSFHQTVNFVEGNPRDLTANVDFNSP